MNAPQLHDVAGVLHVHSIYSDGTGTVPEIAAAAEENGLDFVLLTDHDTLDAKWHGGEGWHGGVLVLVGEEVSPRRENHFLAFGIDEPIDHRGLDAAGIVRKVEEAGGFGFLSHPFSRGSDRFRRNIPGMPWRELDCEGYTGLELWSFLTDTAEQLNGFRDLVRFIARPQLYLDHPPRSNLDQWDMLCGRRRCVALGGIDAHQIGLRIGSRVPFRLMSYRRSFRQIHTHVLVQHPWARDLVPDRDALYGALRAGRAYIARDALADARGFVLWSDGDGPLLMGDEARFEEPRVLRVELPRPARLRLMRDGEQVAGGQELDTLEYRVDGPGVYRVEAYLTVDERERTWILSNPIYLRDNERPPSGGLLGT
jgi:hypothetical protein